MAVADDHPLYRDGVVRALSASRDIVVVAQAGDGQTALALIREHAPEVALVDYRLPGLDGLGVAEAVIGEGLPTRVMLLSAFTDGELVHRALRAGAAGYLSKEAGHRELVEAVLACAGGRDVLDPQVAPALAAYVRNGASEAPGLSEREIEVLRRMATGASAAEIGAELWIAVTTVRTHIRHLYRKLEVSDRGAAVAAGMRLGLLE